MRAASRVLITARAALRGCTTHRERRSGCPFWDDRDHDGWPARDLRARSEERAPPRAGHEQRRSGPRRTQSRRCRSRRVPRGGAAPTRTTSRIFVIARAAGRAQTRARRGGPAPYMRWRPDRRRPRSPRRRVVGSVARPAPRRRAPRATRRALRSGRYGRRGHRRRRVLAHGRVDAGDERPATRFAGTVNGRPRCASR